MTTHRASQDVREGRVVVGLLGVTVALTSTLSCLVPAPAPVVGERRTLGEAGQVNTAVRMGSAGQTVAMVWNARAPDTSAGDVMLAMSRDAGLSFGPPQRVNTRRGDAQVGGEQPPSVVLRSPEEIYVVWRSVQSAGDGGAEHAAHAQNSIVAVYSSDGGRSFTEPQTLHETTQPAFRGFQSAAAGPDGTLYVTWLDGRNADGPKRLEHAAPRQDVYQAAWKPGAVPRETQVQDDVCFCCKTGTAVSPDGTVSAAWRHIYPGALRDIAFAQGINGVFGPPARVSEDHWELEGCPEDGPSLVVDRDGAAHVVWPTVVQDPSPAKRVFYTSSAGGTEFESRSEVPRLGGDTMSHPRLALDERGAPIVVWDEIHNGQRKVALAYGQTAGSERLVFGVPITLSADTPAQYPDVTLVPGGVLVAWTSGNSQDGSVVALRRVDLP